MVRRTARSGRPLALPSPHDGLVELDSGALHRRHYVRGRAGRARRCVLDEDESPADGGGHCGLLSGGERRFDGAGRLVTLSLWL